MVCARTGRISTNCFKDETIHYEEQTQRLQNTHQAATISPAQILTNKLGQGGNKNIFFVGFSQGTMMGLYHLCKRKNQCAGLLGYSGLLFENENFKSEIKSRFPIKLYHGKKDELINYQNSVEASKKLKDMGFEIDFNLSEELGHGIDDEGIKMGLDFIKKTFNI